MGNPWKGRAYFVSCRMRRFFYFYIFYFRFLQKYIFVFEIYRNIPRPPRCRAVGTWSPRCGAAGAFLQKFCENFCRKAPGGPVARQRGGRPPRQPSSGVAGPGCPAAGRAAPPPLYKDWLVPHPSFVSLKFQKPRKEREGGREAKPCRIFKPVTACNQNSSTLYK